MTTTETIAGNDLFTHLEDDWENAARYLSIFIDEAQQTLDELVEALLGLEAGGGRQREYVEQLFVAAHRMKGSAASIGLNRVAKLSHLMEDVLQMLVDTGRTLTPQITDAMLACTDGLRGYVDALRDGRPTGGQFEALAKQIIDAQAAFNGSQDGETQAKEEKAAVARRDPSPPPTEPAAPPSGDPVATPVLGASAVAAVSAELQRRVSSLMREAERDAALVGCVVFEPTQLQVGLKARLLYEKLSNVGEVRYFDPPADDIDLREQLDAICFGVATEASVETVQHLLRITGVRSMAVKPLVTAASPARTPSSAVAKTSDSAPKPAETMRVDIERLDQLMALAGQLAISKARVAQIAEKLKKTLSGGTSARMLDNVAAELENMANGTTASSAGANLRADIEYLRNTAGYLHKDVEAARREVESLAMTRSCINDLFETVHQLDRVSDGIHQSVMQTRMLPIGPLFARFHRVIRDLTRANGKDIRLVISGEKTELDKRMTDELADPMIHMVRNAADHGIESPEAREAAGKPRQGTISLDACHRGSNIVIRVSDDGSGLNADRILAKAIEKGLVSAIDAERMTPQQIYQLIWLPGLSTAEKLTEVSGRGVGMDIVRSKIDEINGTMEIQSEPGRGTTLIVKLPLTLAILPSLMVEIGGDVFAFPLESVVEIVHVRRSDMTTVRGSLVATIRDRVVSVLSLGAIFNWRHGNAAIGDNDTCILVIVGEGNCQLGLAVDRVLGEEDVVIKSIADNYRNLVGIAGASVLGDGRVSLILDPPTLIEMSSNSTHARTEE